MKNAIYSLLLLLTITACSKNDDPKPAAEVQGNWGLKDGSLKTNALGKTETNDFDFSGEGMYLNLKEDNKFETNLGLEYSDEDFFSKVKVYQSTYKVEGDYLIMDIYTGEYDKYVPVKTKITSADNGKLSLTITKIEIGELLKELSKYDDFSTDVAILSLVTSMDLQLNFTK